MIIIETPKVKYPHIEANQLKESLKSTRNSNFPASQQPILTMLFYGMLRKQPEVLITDN
ncbi:MULTISPECIES: hypothetical protein [Okeania]|nr:MULTISPECIES: hypothetical protein [Okeania]NET14432.1 hypothetical protein [Okeania sp. SIO1H6]NET19691.1 hypothetical protein [Okeania sp. SIO1H5]NET74632.1 hypothetical protein [Okeania sp. SIO1F9]NET93617.1 hypothetical protein [Okeania sp. SIO1H2]